VLFLLARVITKLEPREGKWDVPCSSQELAQFAQVTPETMSRVMRELEDEGVIRKNKTHLWILKKKAFEPYFGEG
jgi:DNA-binding transcriptional regulator YhcF (GntR family)